MADWSHKTACLTSKTVRGMTRLCFHLLALVSPIVMWLYSPGDRPPERAAYFPAVHYGATTLSQGLACTDLMWNTLIGSGSKQRTVFVTWCFCPSTPCQFPPQLAFSPIMTGKAVVTYIVYNFSAAFVFSPHYPPLKIMYSISNPVWKGCDLSRILLTRTGEWVCLKAGKSQNELEKSS